MTSRMRYRAPYSVLAAAVVICVLILAAAPQALADCGVFQWTVPTRTPAYTLPPAPTQTSTPVPTSTPGSPGGTPTPPPSATTQPGDTPSPSTTALVPGTAVPTAPGTHQPTPKPTQPAVAAVLECAAEIITPDVLPGQIVEYALLVTNTGDGPAQSIILQDTLAPGFDPLRVRSTQGVVEVDANLVILRLGIIEAGQSALAILDLQVSQSSLPGQVFVQQARIFSDDGQAMCNLVAAATRPDHLPNTGADRREP